MVASFVILSVGDNPLSCASETISVAGGVLSGSERVIFSLPITTSPIFITAALDSVMVKDSAPSPKLKSVPSSCTGMVAIKTSPEESNTLSALPACEKR